MRLTAEGIKITLNDDPVLLASALNAAVALDEKSQEGPNEERTKLIFWARMLENRFRIWDGKLHPADYADEPTLEQVQTDLHPEDLELALAAYGAHLLLSDETTREYNFETPEILAESERINAAIDRVQSLAA
jgi:hypothetical protein